MNIHYLKKIDAYIHVRVRAVKPKTKFKIFGDGKYSWHGVLPFSCYRLPSTKTHWCKIYFQVKVDFNFIFPCPCVISLLFFFEKLCCFQNYIFFKEVNLKLCATASLQNVKWRHHWNLITHKRVTHKYKMNHVSSVDILAQCVRLSKR